MVRFVQGQQHSVCLNGFYSHNNGPSRRHRNPIWLDPSTWSVLSIVNSTQIDCLNSTCLGSHSVANSSARSIFKTQSQVMTVVFAFSSAHRRCVALNRPLLLVC